MFGGWLALSSDFMDMNMSAQRVIALRLAKLAKGGPAAEREARRMLVEKFAASAEAALALAAGRPPHVILKRYRSLVRANERRLSRGA